MQINEIKSVLAKIFYEITPEVEFDKVDMSRPLREQVEIDSFDFYRIIVQIAQRTGVNIPDSKIPELSNLNELIHYISEQPNHHPPQVPGP